MLGQPKLCVCSRESMIHYKYNNYITKGMLYKMTQYYETVNDEEQLLLLIIILLQQRAH